MSAKKKETKKEKILKLEPKVVLPQAEEQITLKGDGVLIKDIQ